jgi:hypothetical protein
MCSINQLETRNAEGADKKDTLQCTDGFASGEQILQPFFTMTFLFILHGCCFIERYVVCIVVFGLNDMLLLRILRPT